MLVKIWNNLIKFLNLLDRHQPFRGTGKLLSIYLILSPTYSESQSLVTFNNRVEYVRQVCLAPVYTDVSCLLLSVYQRFTGARLSIDERNGRFTSF